MFLVSKRSHFFSSVLLKMFSSNCKIAVCQLTAINVKDSNLEIVKKLISLAVEQEAKVIFLPEGCDYIASHSKEAEDLAEPLDGRLMSEYKKLAAHNKVWLSIGGFHEIDIKQHKICNSHVIINDNGKIESVYRKVHLFDVDIPEKNIKLTESDYVEKGDDIVSPVSSPAGPLGLAICYDLRFPELSTILRKLGAAVLTYPSAFTSTTGQAHWETMLKARAIENQCYVVAAAQYGRHNDIRTSYGQAMIVDPWGKIIAECPKYSSDVPSNMSIAVATIDFELLAKIRQEMPVFDHRRDDVYKLTLFNKTTNVAKETKQYMFANKVIPASTVFFTSLYSYAFTNIRCVVPGHVLIASKRNAKRLEDLTPDEVADFFQTVVKVQKVMETVHSTASSTVCVQDGADAGQTMAHVHCHVLPRRAGDFNKNDDIYLELAKHDRSNNLQPIRTVEEMSKEATVIKKYFSN